MLLTTNRETPCLVWVKVSVSTPTVSTTRQGLHEEGAGGTGAFITALIRSAFAVIAASGRSELGKVPR